MKALAIPAFVLVAVTSAATAQHPSLQEAPYSAALKQIVSLAVTKDGFRSITGAPREGNYLEAGLALAGWNDCLLYGTGTYTCDSPAFKGPDDAQYAQVGILREVQACLGGAWREVKDRSSPSYSVLHHTARPISITLSTDETERKDHVVRLTVFVRRN